MIVNILKLLSILIIILWALPAFAENVLCTNYAAGRIDLPKDKATPTHWFEKAVEQGDGYYKPCMAQSEKECLQDRNFFLRGTLHFYIDNTGKSFIGQGYEDENFTWHQEGSEITVAYEGSTFKKAGEIVKLKLLNDGMMLLFDDTYYGHESLENGK